MDLYDPQMLGVMVFGGFMLVSAIGIFLVSTFSMKETSYEEALAKQRKELEKASQHKIEKKKKEKPIEKKGKARKKEEKPNGRISEPDLDAPGGSKDASPESALVIESAVIEAPVVLLSAPSLEKEKVTPSPKDKKKKEKKVPKLELEVSPSPVTALKVQGTDVTPKQLSVAAVPPAEANPLMDSTTMKKPEALGSEERDGVSKKKAVTKKTRESITADAESALFLPYNTLVSTINSMVFGEGETQQLIEILTEKAGHFQDTWHMATQKGDPMVVLKRQLEEKEKQLVTEQENTALAKTKLRELTKDLGAEKVKTLTVENKLKEQMLVHEKEMAAVQARMQTSYQDHVTETQQLQGKIRTLQEQLENGPNTQLARLQQENSILRDALNQATSQTESKQNAELAKLRQECSKRSKELTEKLETLQQAEEEKAALEMKAAAYEGQIYLLQASQKEKAAPLQKRLDEISEELRVSQANYKSLQADLAKAKGQQASLAELESKLLSSERELKRKEEELTCLQGELSEATSKYVQLAERIRLTEAPLEAGQTKELGKDSDVQAANQTEVNLMQLRMQESSAQISALEKEAAELKHTVEQLQMKNSEALEQRLEEVRAQTKQVLASLFPQVMVEGQQAYDEWLQQFKEKASLLQVERAKAESDTALSLSEADEALGTLQAECNQYRTILAETERMLKDLQKSVEEEEQVWKAKVAASQEALQKSQDQMKCLQDDVQKLKMELQKTDKLKEYTSLLEAQLENHLATASSERQNYTKEVEVLRQLLCESQEHLDTAKTEALRQSQELAQVRQQLREMKSPGTEGSVAGSQADPSAQAPLEAGVLKTQLEQTEVDLHNEHILREKLAAEFEEAQNSVCSLQAELEKLRRDGNVAASATEDILQLQERLEKEKKLTKDLGCAANKLKELLTVTQEQLAKEREKAMKLQEKLQEKGETEDNAKEGTSV